MKRFKKGYIEITNSCNLSCSFCPKTKRDKKFMSEEEFKKIICDIKPFCNFIYLHIMGEPLLHPELNKLLTICDDEKIKVNITSNGTLIKNKLDEILNSKSVRKVSFSLHSFEANEKDDEEKYLNDIIYSSKLLAKNNTVVVLKLWNLDSTNIDVCDKEGKNNLNDYIIDKLISEFNDEKNKDKIIKTLFEKNTVELSKHIYLQFGEKFEWPVQTSDENKFNSIACYGSIDQFGITANGDVIPCCLDNDATMSFGNVYKESFKDIIHKDDFIKFNNNIKSGIPPHSLCEKCSYARRRINNEIK